MESIKWIFNSNQLVSHFYALRSHLKKKRPRDLFFFKKTSNWITFQASTTGKTQIQTSVHTKLILCANCCSAAKYLALHLNIPFQQFAIFLHEHW